MHIKSGKGLAVGDNGAISGQRLNQTLKLVMTFDGDFRAALIGQRQVADKLQGVAQTLLGMEQEPCARKRLAIPLRLREVSPGAGKVGTFPSPFVLLPARCKFTPCQQCQGKIVVGFGIVRLQGDGLVIGGDGLFQVPFGLPASA